MDRYLPKIQELNGLISYDFSDDFDRAHALSICKYIDFGFFSCSDWTEKEVKELLEKAVQEGCTLAVATRGPDDVMLYNGQSWFYQAPEAIQPVDTLGAGDAFITAFLISYVEGKANTGVLTDELIRSSLDKAASFAAKICQLQGAFGHGLSY